MPVTPEEVDYIAKLAKIALTPEERLALTRDLDEIVSYVDRQKALSVESIPPTTHVISQEDILRSDELQPSLAVDAVLKMAPASDRGHLVVPPVLEESA